MRLRCDRCGKVAEYEDEEVEVIPETFRDKVIATCAYCGDVIVTWIQKDAGGQPVAEVNTPAEGSGGGMADNKGSGGNSEVSMEKFRCFRCRDSRLVPREETTIEVTRNGRYRLVAACPVCGYKMGKFTKGVDEKRRAKWLEERRKAKRVKVEVPADDKKVVDVITTTSRGEVAGRPTGSRPPREEGASRPRPPSTSSPPSSESFKSKQPRQLNLSGAFIALAVMVALWTTQSLWALLGLFFVVFTVPKFNEIADGIRAWLFRKSEMAKIEAERAKVEDAMRELEAKRAELEAELQRISEYRQRVVAELEDIKRAVGVDEIRKRQEEELKRRNEFEAELLEKYNAVVRMFSERIDNIARVEREVAELRAKIGELMEKLGEQPEPPQVKVEAEKPEPEVKVVEKVKEKKVVVGVPALDAPIPIETLMDSLPEADVKIKATFGLLLINKAMPYSAITAAVPEFWKMLGRGSMHYSLKDLERFIKYFEKRKNKVQVGEYVAQIEKLMLNNTAALQLLIREADEESEGGVENKSKVAPIPTVT